MDDSFQTERTNSISAVVATPTGNYDAAGWNNNTRTPQWVDVLVDVPQASSETQQSIYTYQIREGLEVQPGDILSVPFASQQIGAIAIRHRQELPRHLSADTVRLVEDVVVAGFFRPTYWQLLEKVAHYYYAPLMSVIRTALPPGLLGKSSRRLRLTHSYRQSQQMFLSQPAQEVLALLQQSKTGDYTWKYLRKQVHRADRGIRELLKLGWVESYLEPPRHSTPKLQQAVTLVGEQPAENLSYRQQEVLQVLRRSGGEMWLQELLQICRTSSSVVKALQKKGCVEITQQERLRAPNEGTPARDEAKSLTEYQRYALETIWGLDGYAQVLLHGITGSGKTEVYLQAIAPILEAGKSAIVLVPEIGLTPQLTDRFRARFGDRVCVYHSALSSGERFDAWRQMLADTPQVVIGTRTAIFAPLKHLGCIILDEEYDASYKQDRTPTYHARTVAQWRAELEQCPLILGSATPSIETWAHIQGHLSPETAESQTSVPTYYLSLPERIHARPLPDIEVVDMRNELRQGNRSIFSRHLQSAMRELENSNAQGILFIPRRGHSTFVSCRSCGYVVECPNCDVSLSYHYTYEGASEWLRCHYCNFMQPHPQQCPECESPYLKHFGTGTQRVMQELNKRFPHLNAIRFDSDTTRTKGSHRALLERFARGSAKLLVGTQMLTKGLDLPQVTLVGIVAADGLLNISDYRASERAFQTLTQVSGRAGRGEDPGRVILQTYTPNHPAIEAVSSYDYQAFVESELEQREALGYPPYGKLVLLSVGGYHAEEVEEVAERLTAYLRGALDVPEEGDGEEAGVDILGPAPAPIVRIAKRYRWQVLLKFDRDCEVTLPDIDELRRQCPAAVSLTVDVDPMNLG